MNKKYTTLAVGLTALASLAVASPAFAQTNNGQGASDGTRNGSPMHTPGGPGGMGMWGGARGGMMRPAVFGTVTAVSGNTITLSGRQGFGTSTPATTYTIDATNAVIKKNNATSTISSILVGDTLVAQGTITGSNVVAVMIRDGVLRNPGGMMNRDGNDQGQIPAQMMGNGEPVVAGTVSSVNGTTLVITNKSNVQYTIDTTNAKILQGQTTVTLSSVAVGDSVFVQGTTNGNSVTATTVFDQKAPSVTPGQPGENNGNGKPAPRGFFGGIGDFFKHLFGF